MARLSIPGLENLKRNRSASLVWVDFLTAPSVETPPYVSDDEESNQSDSSASPKKQYTASTGRIDDDIFNAYADLNSDTILIGKFLAMLERNGLQRNDFRLRGLFKNLRTIWKGKDSSRRGHLDDDWVGSIETLRLTREEFQEVIIPDIFVICNAFRNQFVIPKFDLFCQQLEDIFNECKMIQEGTVATYLRKLATMDPSCWGVALCTTDGQRCSFGDANKPVTFHALSKPLMYAYALEEIGKNDVHKYVGQEPSGHMFNELVLDHEKRPHNPMINAGSIMIHALLQKFVQPGITVAERFDMTHELFERMAGGEYIGFNNGMFLNKRQASDRNWALGHFMKEQQCFPPGTDLNDCLEYYLQTSSMETTIEVLSVIAATLANGGICPITGNRILQDEVVADVLSVMYFCGMLEFSGKFAFRVGLPAKSSVSGAMIVVVPNVAGFAMWSPPLDQFTNSVKGLAFCEKLVQTFNFHCFDTDKAHKIDPRRKFNENKTKGSNCIALLAAANGDLEALFMFHLRGIDMSIHDCDWRTPLHFAACEGHYSVCEYLLKYCGVPHDMEDRWGNTPYDGAKRFGHVEVAELLRTWNPDQAKVPSPSQHNQRLETDEQSETSSQPMPNLVNVAVTCASSSEDGSED